MRHHGEAQPFGPLAFTEPPVRVLAMRERSRVVEELKRALETS